MPPLSRPHTTHTAHTHSRTARFAAGDERGKDKAARREGVATNSCCGCLQRSLCITDGPRHCALSPLDHPGSPSRHSHRRTPLTPRTRSRRRLDLPRVTSVAETKRRRRATSRQIHAAAGRSERCAARSRSASATRAPWTIQGRLPATLTAAHHSPATHALADGWICRARRAWKRLRDGAHRPPLHSCCACKSSRACFPPLLRENAPWGTFALPTGTDGAAQHDSATAAARVRPRPSSSAAAAAPLSPCALFLRVFFLRMIREWRRGWPMAMPAGAGHSAFQQRVDHGASLPCGSRRRRAQG